MENQKVTIKKTTIIEDKVEISLKEIKQQFETAFTTILSNYYIYSEEPELSCNDYNNSVTIDLNTDTSEQDGIIDDAIFEAEALLEKLINRKIEESKELPEAHETGEVGV